MTTVTFTRTVYTVRTSLYQTFIVAVTESAACSSAYTVVANSAVAVLVAIGIGVARDITRVIR